MMIKDDDKFEEEENGNKLMGRVSYQCNVCLDDMIVQIKDQTTRKKYVIIEILKKPTMSSKEDK